MQIDIECAQQRLQSEALRVLESKVSKRLSKMVVKAETNLRMFATNPSQMEEQLELEKQKESVLAQNKQFNESHCLRCFCTFIMLINPKRVCNVCNYKVCKKCSQYMRNTWDVESESKKVYVCFACYKQK